MVYKTATALGLEGYVKNGSNGLHIFFNASEQIAAEFFSVIQSSAPAQSKIIIAELRQSQPQVFNGFSIVADEEDATVKEVLMSPDKAPCDACLREMFDENNRRFRYPFITCTQCGPRYSIVAQLPYERHFTAMSKFTMCDACKTEYDHVEDRRFFSQTNSCDSCGIKLSISGGGHVAATPGNEAILRQVKRLLATGKIVAVKGVGGYLLLCDGANSKAIQLLRERKHRPAKPFAVLYPSIQKVVDSFEVNEAEIALLNSIECPIVLIQPTEGALNDLAIESIAPGLNRVGVMLPSSPLLHLIATDFSKPLIATSANISGSPVIYNDDDAKAYLPELADYIVSYNRDILIPQDDSVMLVTKHAEKQITLRRSRGLAPSFLHYKPGKQQCILATGAFLKSTFTLAVNSNIFISQYLGSGESYESQDMYKHTLQHWLKLYEAHPEVVITDHHHGYFSHQFADELSKENGTRIIHVQHHQAHFAAVLAENNLLESDEPILGVIWDGTGLGTDGNIWGGEFFTYADSAMLRCYYFDYYPAIAGDKMAAEPRIAALCATAGMWPQSDILKHKFSEKEWNNYQSLLNSTTLFTSSVGRLFDAVASLLNVCDKQTYEGEAAQYVQALAERYVSEHGFKMEASYFASGAHYYRIPTASLMQNIIADIEKGKATDYIAAKFHYSLVYLVAIVAKNLGTTKIAFSGGVFQNQLLVDWLIWEHSDNYQLYFHQHLSPNDENISFGQMVWYDNEMNAVKYELRNMNDDILAKKINNEILKPQTD